MDKEEAFLAFSNKATTKSEQYTYWQDLRKRAGIMRCKVSKKKIVKKTRTKHKYC